MACSAVSSRSTSCSLSTSRSSCDLQPFLAGAGAGLALPRGSGMALFGEHGRSKHLGKVWQWDELMKRARAAWRGRVFHCWFGQRISVGRGEEETGTTKTATAQRRVVTEGRGMELQNLK
jgi:hypothetical protein